MKKLVVLVTTIFIFIGWVGFFYSEDVLANSADFSVKAILPDTQKATSKSYFDFELLPNTNQQIEIEIENKSSEKKSYSIQVNTATTNINGVIDYTESDRKPDSTLKIGLGDIVTVADSVTVPAGENLRVPIELKMPNQQFEGILLGGITVVEAEEEQTEQQISNRYSYSVAIVLSQGDKIPEVELDLTGVPISQINRRNVISATIQNSTAAIANDLSVDAKIYRKGQDSPLFHRKESGMRMAPNSNFDFWVETNNQPLKAGKYVMKVHAVLGDQEWVWSEEFEITKQEARDLNETAVALETDYTVVYLWVAVGFLTVLLVIILLLVLKNKRGGEK